MGFTVPAAYGRGLFLGKGLLPLQTPINVVVGAPIPCKKFDGDIHGPEGMSQQLGRRIACRCTGSESGAKVLAGDRSSDMSA